MKSPPKGYLACTFCERRQAEFRKRVVRCPKISLWNDRRSRTPGNLVVQGYCNAVWRKPAHCQDEKHHLRRSSRLAPSISSRHTIEEAHRQCDTQAAFGEDR